MHNAFRLFSTADQPDAEHPDSHGDDTANPQLALRKFRQDGGKSFHKRGSRRIEQPLNDQEERDSCQKIAHCAWAGTASVVAGLVARFGTSLLKYWKNSEFGDRTSVASPWPSAWA